MLESNTRAWLEVDLSKIRHNVDEITKLIPSSTKIMAIVKANSYGHGDIAVTRELIKCGVDFFGVSSVDEALRLREHGIMEPILILGYTPPTHFHYLIEQNLIQSFISLEYAKKADAYCKEHQVTMRGHVKIDTGMSRLGIICQEHEYHIDDVLAVYALAHLQVEGIFTHFSVSDGLDEDNKAYTSRQIEMFDRVLKDVEEAGIHPGIRHLQNSYGILNYPNLHYDYVRPGLLFLGATSDNELQTITQPDFQPIMELKANVSLVKTIQDGICVSYGRHFTSKGERKIATVSIGYADGYPRSLSNTGAQALVHGTRVEIVGNICMDQMMLDVTGIEDVKEGDVVTLFGCDGEECMLIDELTRRAHTINNETFCWISARVPRIYK